MASTTVRLTTLSTIDAIDRDMDRHAVVPGLEPIPAFIRAILVATGMTEPVVVRVPQRSIHATVLEDLDMRVWMATDPDHPFTSCDDVHLDVDGVQYYVIGPARVSPMGTPDLVHPVNALMDSLQPSGVPPFRGNVLIFRVDRQDGERARPFDVQESDMKNVQACVFGLAIGSDGASHHLVALP
ncbi:hypothetical protein DFH06DRAFT_1141152 [Mycena polygramma]|nr:hypothetical protein DFH06DRAFT_1344891 [Mycena polygramma]KAJ7623011.1 hypothetical protein DFH06DRAFT_1142805 [Mycena polygramma]KAJ7629147.1 hypothetical protein DFH06DRAFT_1141152 [Mycena polygramma]